MSLDKIKIRTETVRASPRKFKCKWSLSPTFLPDQIMGLTTVEWLWSMAMQDVLKAEGLTGLFARFSIGEIEEMAGKDVRFAKILANPDTK